MKETQNFENRPFRIRPNEEFENKLNALVQRKGHALGIIANV